MRCQARLANGNSCTKHVKYYGQRCTYHRPCLYQRKITSMLNSLPTYSAMSEGDEPPAYENPPMYFEQK